jgi:hypothetical protein
VHLEGPAVRDLHLLQQGHLGPSSDVQAFQELQRGRSLPDLDQAYTRERIIWRGGLRRLIDLTLEKTVQFSTLKKYINTQEKYSTIQVYGSTTHLAFVIEISFLLARKTFSFIAALTLLRVETAFPVLVTQINRQKKKRNY